MFDQNMPVLICTDATLVMGILSSELPKNRGLIRNTRSGPTSIRVGKKKLPRVKRLALNTWVALEDALELGSALDMVSILRRQAGQELFSVGRVFGGLQNVFASPQVTAHKFLLGSSAVP